MKLKSLTLFSIISPVAFASVSNGPYVGLEFGAANEVLVFNAGTPYNSGANAYSPSISFLGRLNIGYNSTKYSGFELGATYNSSTGFNYPTVTGTMNLNATTLDLSYILYLPTAFEGVSAFGRVGVAYDWLNSSGGCNCEGISSASANSFADVMGAGIKYNITSKTSFRAEWLANGLLFPVSINSGSINTAAWTNQTFMLGINLHF